MRGICPPARQHGAFRCWKPRSSWRIRSRLSRVSGTWMRAFGTMPVSDCFPRPRENMHGTQGKEAPLLAQLRQRCRRRDEALQEGDREKRTWRSRRTREEPQAGDRDRPVESAQEGQEGPEESSETEVVQEDVKEDISENIQEDFEEEFEENVEAQIFQTVALTSVRSCCPA